MPRTFAIDTRWIESKVAAAGTRTYIEELTKALLALDHENRYHLWGSPINVTASNAHNFNFQGNYRRAWQLIWKTIGWPPVDVVHRGADLWHFTNYVAPPTRKPFALTMHDLSFVTHPEFTEKKNLEYLKKFVPDSLQRASHVIAVSDSTRRAVMEEFNVPANKITTTHQAAKPIYGQTVPKEELSRIKEKYGIDQDYVLAVGTLEPRKNLKNLLLAFAAMRRNTTQQLVITGGQGWLFDETEELLRKLGLGSRAILTGYVPDRELPALYQGASVFVFPSFYEGFGLPILEAMMSGTPVITSNTSSMPEVGGTAALYFDPADTKGLRLAIERVLADEALRERLAETGREQAAKFSWEQTARKTLGTYHKALGESNVRVVGTPSDSDHTSVQ
ncbi:glycosyltransferase family 1 protein [Patescibacteria group bacterium]|nr:glycosyltransferase family 1 protein [Patescibacteria group bacterium]